MHTDSRVNEKDRLIAAASPAEPHSVEDSPAKPVQQAAGSSANDVVISVEKAESSDKEKFYDAKSTTLPIYGRHSVDAEIIAEPREAEPQVNQACLFCCHGVPFKSSCCQYVTARGTANAAHSSLCCSMVSPQTLT